ncbi:Rhodanese-like domain-containing protein [Neohortaea acidophila]|uniref:Rhodanese-like domain-containing protein n=1 Tax=Neohortaea acidophila TaxID=245834 RepID=A0A6A6Q3U2_9PEZI|nr:Rhodanese-like domain-containing protein [Neohortaea acidophila]KAF2486699.1 Rhodanese-like domain-containing protein [Neohortaea acidophila]
MAATLLIRPHSARPGQFSRAALSATLLTSRRQSTLRNFLVTPAELREALRKGAPSGISPDPKTIAVCASWFLPNDPHKRTGYEVYKQAHIKRARFFDLDKVADTSSPYPHMLPSPEVFQEAMCNLGINREDTVVVYDSAELGIFSAPRVAWTFKAFGHPAVHILNNFKLWLKEKYPIEQGEQRRFNRTEYPVPTLDESKIADYEQVRVVARDHNKEGREEMQILDARPAGRFNGTDPEPRPGLESGHIPGSISVPFPDLLDPKTKAMLPPEDLRKLFESKGINPNQPIISSCGTGVTAAVLDTALIQAGFGKGVRQVYDGSWTEWAQRVAPSDNFIVKSE